MKKIFNSIVFLLVSTYMSAQGIAVQGIARDNNASAISDVPLNFTFSIIRSDNTVIYAETKPIRTDLFGVFSHIVSDGSPTMGSFASVDFGIENLRLKVSIVYGGNTIQVYDQPFYYTPYAHFAKKATLATNAEDGVPTGAVMPYIGATAPTGWVLCDGSSIAANTAAVALRAMIGNNVPDLRGMFIRGAGTNAASTSHVGPSLKAIQEDAFEGHGHDYSSNTGGNGGHNHGFSVYRNYGSMSSGGQGAVWRDANGSETYNGTTGSVGNHTHTVSGTTNSTGDNETRPVNYGVNYIIKL
jgi:microcystin-dependent protein